MKININLDTKQVVIFTEDSVDKTETITLEKGVTKEHKTPKPCFEVIDESYESGNLSYQTILVHTKIPKVYYLLNDDGILFLYDTLGYFRSCGSHILRASDEQVIDDYLMSLVLDEK